MSISKDSRNWYMKVSVRSGMLDEHVRRVRFVNFYKSIQDSHRSYEEKFVKGIRWYFKG